MNEEKYAEEIREHLPGKAEELVGEDRQYDEPEIEYGEDDLEEDMLGTLGMDIEGLGQILTRTDDAALDFVYGTEISDVAEVYGEIETTSTPNEKSSTLSLAN